MGWRAQMVDRTHAELVGMSGELSRVLLDPGVVAFLRSPSPPLPAHTIWFLSQHARILSEVYTPLLQDSLRMRVRTTGVNRLKVCPPPSMHPTPRPLTGNQPRPPSPVPFAQLRTLDRPFEAIDVGGMRVERRKWRSLMGGADGVLFAVGLSDWRQQLREDSKTNRFAESLDLFESTARELGEMCVAVTLPAPAPAVCVAPRPSLRRATTFLPALSVWRACAAACPSFSSSPRTTSYACIWPTTRPPASRSSRSSSGNRLAPSLAATGRLATRLASRPSSCMRASSDRSRGPSSGVAAL